MNSNRLIRSVHFAIVEINNLVAAARGADIAQSIKLGHSAKDAQQWADCYAKVFRIHASIIRPAVDSLRWRLEWYDPDSNYDDDVLAYHSALEDLKQEHAWVIAEAVAEEPETFRVIMKTAYSLADALRNECKEPEEQKRIEAFCEKWFKYGEVVTLEIDIERETIRVVPIS